MQAKKQEVPKLTLEQIVTKLDELPTLPTIVYELSKAINNPMSSTKEVEDLMSKDQSMTMKVLKLVNSAYYAIPGGVTSLSRAIAYIGFDTINQLVLSASILKALEVKGPTKFDMNEFWKHSLGVGIAGETLAKFTHHPLPSDLFTCGLVHDMGKVALYSINQEALVMIAKQATDTASTFFEAETALDYPRHSVIGAHLAEKWRLPQLFQAVIKHHHQKDPALRGGLSADFNKAVDLIYLANIIIHALKFGNSGHSKILGAPTDVMERLTIDPEKDFKKLLVEIKSNLDKASDFLRVLGA